MIKDYYNLLPSCLCSNCAHYTGDNTCKVFPKKIPNALLDYNNIHKEILLSQEGDYVYQPSKEYLDRKILINGLWDGVVSSHGINYSAKKLELILIRDELYLFNENDNDIFDALSSFIFTLMIIGLIIGIRELLFN